LNKIFDQSQQKIGDYSKNMRITLRKKSAPAKGQRRLGDWISGCAVILDH
jgi:hypothetical protein